MLLFFTDLVNKCRTPHAATYRSTLTYAICLVQDILSILVVTLLDRLPSRGHKIGVIHFALTTSRAAILMLGLILNIYSFSNDSQIVSESLIGAARGPQNGGYGTIPQENGKDMAQSHKTSMPSSPTSPIWGHLFKYIWLSMAQTLSIKPN